MIRTKPLWWALWVILTIAAPTAGAEEVPPGSWWHDPVIAKNLNLNPGEIRQLDQLFLENRRNLIDLKSRVEKEQLELNRYMGSGQKSDQKAKDQFQKLESARSALSEERFRYVIRVRDILGPQRFQQLQANYRKWK